MSGSETVSAPSVPDDSVIYAIGDIHGEAAKLDRLHAAIRDDADSRKASRRVVVYLGDYIDRGPDPAGVIDRLTGDPLPGFETIFLMGNHEEFLLGFLENARIGPNWLANGGTETMESYGVEVTGLYALNEASLALAECMPAAHRNFLRALTFYHIEGSYLFVHAGIRPGYPPEAQRSADLLWIRDDFLRSTDDHGHIVVHGHTPSRAPDIHPNRIGIDTGACYGGSLTALVLAGTERTFLHG